MDVTLILKIAGVGLIIAVSSQVLSKTGRDDLTPMLSIAGILMVMLLLVSEMGDVLSKVKEIFSL